jgi:hypothetical protein
MAPMVSGNNSADWTATGERGQIHFLERTTAADSHSLMRPYALTGHAPSAQCQGMARQPQFDLPDSSL